jgi:hypothetical protein
MGGSVRPMSLTDNLVAYWKMDEASGNREDAQAALDLTDVNTVGSAAGKISTAGDYIAANSENLTRGGGLTTNGASRTVSLWAKPDLTGTQRGVANASNQAATPLSAGPLWLMVQRATDVWAVFHGAAYRDTSTPTIVAGNWYHLVYTFDSGTNGVVLYVNGVSRATATAADNAVTPTHTYFGGGFNAYFDGLIDECGIWSRALTSDEVTSLYNSGNGFTYPFIGAQAQPGRAAAAVGHGQLGLASGLRTFRDLMGSNS